MSTHKRKKSYKSLRKIVSGIISAVILASIVMGSFVVNGVNPVSPIAGESDTEPFYASQIDGLSFKVELKANAQWRVTFSGRVNIPANITDAEEFKEFKDNIDEIVIESDITGIEAHAFESMVGLDTVIFKENSSVTKIGDAAFKDCTYLSNVNLENCTALTAIGSTSSIGSTEAQHTEGAFENTALKELTIPANLLSIGDRAFYKCTDLEKVSIEENCRINYIGMLSFAYCEALESINLENCRANPITFNCINDSNTGAFNHCSSLKSVTVPGGASGSLSGLFKGSSSLESITFEENDNNITDVTQIVRDTSVDVLDFTPLTRLENIGAWQIRGPMSTVLLSGNVKTLGQSVMGENNSSLNFVIFEQNTVLTEIPRKAFEMDSSLISVNLEALEGLLKISDEAFSGCKIMPVIEIPSGVTTLGNNVFDGCAGLLTFTYNAANLTNVGTDIFKDAGKFDFVIGPDVKTISVDFLQQAESHFASIKFDGPTTFTVGTEGQRTGLSTPFEIGGTYVSDNNGNLYRVDNGTAKLIYANKNASELTIPVSVGGYPITAIGKYAFQNCSLKKLTVDAPKNIKKIEDYAFAGAVALEEINGKTFVEEIKALFVGINISDNAFFNTAIAQNSGITEDKVFDTNATAQPHNSVIGILRHDGDDDGETGDRYGLNFAVSNHGDEIKKEEDKERAGKFWTGQAASIGVGSTSGYPARIYIRAAQGCEISVDLEGVEVFPTDTDGIYYIDFDYSEGGITGTHVITISYPNFSAPGNKVQVWGVGFNSESDFNSLKNSSNANSVIYPASGAADGSASGGDGQYNYSYKVTNEYFEIEWTTKPNNFDVTKEPNSNVPIKFVLASDGSITLKNLSFNITFKNADSSWSGVNLGSDIVRYVDYSDKLTLPEHISWREGLNPSTAHFTIRDGSGTLYVNIRGIEYELCTVSGFGNIADMSVKEENGSYVICWRVINPSITAEIPAVPNGYITFGSEILVAEGIKAGDSIGKITNTITADQSFTFSDNQTDSAECTITGLTANESELTIKKERLNDVDRMGENVSYKITVENPSAFDYTNLEYILDRFEGQFNGGPTHYLKPENMRSLFEGTDGEYLTITIENAVLARPLTQSKSVNLIDESEAQNILSAQNSANAPDQLHSGLSGEDSVAYRNVTITLKKSANNIILAYMSDKTSGKINIGPDQTHKNIASALDSIGYIVTVSDSYHMRWDYPEGYRFKGGAKKEIIIHATIKNSLMFLPDMDAYLYYGYPNIIELPYWNSVELHNRSNEVVISDSTSANSVAKRDLKIGKGATVNGQLLDSGLEIVDGDILDYYVQIDHWGSGSYNVLPVVDHMTGLQVVIVRKDENRGAEWAAYAETYIDKDGVEYYVLNALKNPNGYTYKGVYTDGFYADSITVKPVSGGMDTLIKYYIQNTPARDFVVAVSYKAISSSEFAGVENTYAGNSIGNEAWLNDRPGHRIYDVIGTGGVAVGFDKNIVTDKNEDPKDDALVKTLPITEQNNVITYRLDLYNIGSLKPDGTGAATSTVTGEDIFDMLPLTGTAFEWKEGTNISLSYRMGKAGYVEGIDYSTNDPDVYKDPDVYAEILYDGNKFPVSSYGDECPSHGDEWSISDESRSSLVQSGEADQRYIIWDEKFEVRLPAAAVIYIYVTLEFPDAVQDQQKWDTFIKEKSTGGALVNAFYVYDLFASVTHIVAGTPKAFIQKGVVETGSYIVDNSGGLINGYKKGTDRLHYSNNRILNSNGTPDTAQCSTVNTVTYYVVIRNSGNTNLYLAPVYDVLPEGYRYMALRSGFGTNINHVGSSDIARSQDIPTQYGGPNQIFVMPEQFDYWYGLGHFAYARVKYSYYDNPQFTDDGRQILKFELYDSGEGNPSYKPLSQDENGNYYLKPGEFIQFGYTVYTGNANITEAQNTVAMQYYDPHNTGVSAKLDENTPLAFSSQNFVCDDNTHNDGERYLWNEKEAANRGFTDKIGDQTSNTQWFASDVTVKTDHPTPGIVKTVPSAMVKKGTNVNWTVSSYNDGASSISGYSITDTVDAPLLFEGDFKYSLYGPDNKRYASAYDINGNPSLFRIKRDNGKIVIYPNTSPEEGTELKYGEELPLNVIIAYDNQHLNNSNLQAEIVVLITKDENGYETLRVKFEDERWDILPSGYSEFIISTDTSQVTAENEGMFENKALLSPYDKEYNSGNVTRGDAITENGTNVGVESSAFVNIYFETPSASRKLIEEKDDPNNNGASDTPKKNHISLSGKDKIFTYTLEVNNVKLTNSQGPMTDLVIIDNLPQPGDSSILRADHRDSEFWVSLAENPNVSVWLKGENGEYKKLGSSDYIVQYSNLTGGFEVNDWQNRADVGNHWYNTPTNSTRSVRICVLVEIPAGASVQVKFDAVISDPDAKPGQIAWNNFGYSYTANGVNAKATPAKVGVSIPGVPTLSKTIVNAHGDQSPVSENTTFRFVIYKSKDSIAFSGYTAEEVGESLKKAGVQFMYVELTVPAGKSVSELLYLEEFVLYSYANGKFTKTNSLERWIEGAAYHAVELQPDGDFVFKSAIGSDMNDFAFTFDHDGNTEISFVNLKKWSIKLTKTDDDNNTLDGAMFGIYTSNESERMSDEAFNGLNIDEHFRSITVDGTNYYLMDVKTSGEDGVIEWRGLDKKVYVVIEIAPPEGYILNEDTYVITYSDAAKTADVYAFTVQNSAGSLDFPETGGIGTQIFYVAGVILIGAALLVLIIKKNKEKNIIANCNIK